jgi:membrane-bound serine protease (ClpP class)
MMPGVGTSVRRALALAAAVLPLWGFASAEAQGVTPTVVEVRLEGVVDPFTANHVTQGIEAAEEASAAAVLVTMDTPGGLDSSMREITQAILNARVPVLCYVSPEGARAASAGTFILLSCHVAAMAPATNVGAAHPVGVAGAIESEKAANDAAEYIVSIAERRGRNADWAERAVRESESASASQALELGVIDLIAPSVPALLEEVTGRTVELADGRTVTLDLAGARIEHREMGLIARLLHALLDPNVAFILFYLGIIALYFEIANPGLGVPAIIGIVLLVTAFLAFGVLPVQLAGVILLIASAIFFAIEIFTPGIGVPFAGGLVTLILGGIFLFDTSVPGVRVSPWVIIPVALFTALFFGMVVTAVVRVQRRPAFGDLTHLVGRRGVVVRDLAPEGVVRIEAEEWSAVTDRGTLPAGTPVVVTAVDGLRLQVTEAEERSPAGDEDREGSVT